MTRLRLLRGVRRYLIRTKVFLNPHGISLLRISAILMMRNLAPRTPLHPDRKKTNLRKLLGLVELEVGLMMTNLLLVRMIQTATYQITDNPPSPPEEDEASKAAQSS
jgi:hypothetical protein